MSLVIIDTGCANIASVRFAFERIGASPVVSRDPATVKDATRLVFPGVGAAPAAMQALAQANLINVLHEFKRPLLGICLGMQLLFDRSEEGDAPGLSRLSGTISSLPAHGLPMPHMGWNRLISIKSDPLLEGIKEGAQVYFLHSFAAPVAETTLATCEYGAPFSAIVRKGNIMGCQFHPERSGNTGSKILQNFLELPA